MNFNFNNHNLVLSFNNNPDSTVYYSRCTKFKSILCYFRIQNKFVQSKLCPYYGNIDLTNMKCEEVKNFSTMNESLS